MKAGIEINTDGLHDTLAACLAYLTSQAALDSDISTVTAFMGDVGGYDVHIVVVDMGGGGNQAEVSGNAECVRGELE